MNSLPASDTLKREVETRNVSNMTIVTLVRLIAKELGENSIMSKCFWPMSWNVEVEDAAKGEFSNSALAMSL